MRLATVGPGYNSLHEFQSSTGSPEISTSVYRSSGASLDIVQSGVRKLASVRYTGTAAFGPFYHRGYLRVDVLPALLSGILRLVAGTVPVWVNLNTTGTLELNDEDGVIGTSTYALKADSVFRKIGLEFDASGAAGSHIIRLSVDDVVVVEATNRTIDNGCNQIDVGGNTGNEADSTGHWYWCDIAVNDNTTADDNAMPGDGRLAYFRPESNGDANSGVTRGGADSGADWSQLDEDPENDATDYLILTGASAVAWCNVPTASARGMDAQDTVRFVAVGARVRADSAGTTNYLSSLKSQAAGTVVDGAAVTITNASVFNTHDDSSGTQQYRLVQYTDPQTGSQWTVPMIDSMQIGVKTTDGSPPLDVTILWAVVEYTRQDPPWGNMSMVMARKAA